MNEKSILEQVIFGVLKDSNYSGSLFTDLEIQSLGNDIFSQKEEYTNRSSQTALLTQPETLYKVQDGGGAREITLFTVLFEIGGSI